MDRYIWRNTLYVISEYVYTYIIWQYYYVYTYLYIYKRLHIWANVVSDRKQQRTGKFFEIQANVEPNVTKETGFRAIIAYKGDRISPASHSQVPIL